MDLQTVFVSLVCMAAIAGIVIGSLLYGDTVPTIRHWLGVCAFNNRMSILKAIEWVGTGASVLGSYLIAFGIIPMGYCCFVLGSSSWLFVAYRMRNMPLGVLNLFFFVANIIGIYRSF